jgi:hypothetical protein
VAGAEPAEPVDVGVGREDGFAREGAEGALVLADPGLDKVEAVVALWGMKRSQTARTSLGGRGLSRGRAGK